MFRIIGFAVVVAVLVVGFGPLKDWYAGTMSPEDTVKEIRQRVGESVAGNSDNETTRDPRKARGEDTDVRDQPSEESEKKKPLSAEEMLQEMMKDK